MAKMKPTAAIPGTRKSDGGSVDRNPAASAALLPKTVSTFCTVNRASPDIRRMGVSTARLAARIPPVHFHHPACKSQIPIRNRTTVFSTAASQLPASCSSSASFAPTPKNVHCVQQASENPMTKLPGAIRELRSGAAPLPLKNIKQTQRVGARDDAAAPPSHRRTLHGNTGCGHPERACEPQDW